MGIESTLHPVVQEYTFLSYALELFKKFDYGICYQRSFNAHQQTGIIESMISDHFAAM